MDLERIEKALNVKIIGIEEVRERVFPLFDLVEVGGLRVALISNPVFVVVDKEDIYEKKIEGNYIVAETANGYLLMKYAGEPDIEALRTGRHAKGAGKEEEELDRKDGKDGKEQMSGGDEGNAAVHEPPRADPVREILEKLPKWSHGAVVIKKDGGIAVLPVKRSTKKDGFYASVTWKPLNISGIESLINHVITKDGKIIKSDVHIGDKYINIFVGTHSSNRPRRYYSGRRR